MALTKMIAIEYNMWMSIMALIDKTIKTSRTKYAGINNSDITVAPAYPRNLTEFKKPSIIVQKVGTDNEPPCFGGYLGQYYDREANKEIDVFGINYESLYQLDVCSDSNTQRSLITALITDEMFNRIRFRDDKDDTDNGMIEIYDYTTDFRNPSLMGYARIDSEIDVRNLDKKYRPDNEYKLYNYDYATAIRFSVSMIQVVVPEQKLIDLGKTIKITQRVKSPIGGI